jgi:hypothetical protein
MKGMRIVIAEKIPQNAQRKLVPSFEEKIRRLSSDLDAEVRVSVIGKGFIEAEVQGSDAELLSELIKTKMRLAPRNLSEIEIGDNFKSYVSGVNKERQAVQVEIGPVSSSLNCEITRKALKAQLCDGREMPVEKTIRSFCLEEDVPVFVRIDGIDPIRKRIEAWISDNQIARYEQWRRERFNRIIAVGGPQDEIQSAIRLTNADRDIIDVEELSFTTSALVCKLGTDGPGIIAKIGRHLSSFRLHTFLPDRVDTMRTK